MVWILGLIILLFGLFLLLIAFVPNSDSKTRLNVWQKTVVILVGGVLSFSGYGVMNPATPAPAQSVTASTPPPSEPTPTESEPMTAANTDKATFEAAEAETARQIREGVDAVPEPITTPQPLTATEKFAKLLGSIIENPKIIKSYDPFTTDRGSIMRSYDPKGFPEVTFIAYPDQKNAWKFMVTPDGITPTKLGAVEEWSDLPFGKLYKITSGPLKSAFLVDQTYNDGAKQMFIESFAHAVREKTGFVATVLVEKNQMPGVKTVDKGEMIRYCEDLVKENLSSPSTAKFAGWLEKLDAGITLSGNGDRLYKSYVDSENGFGAMLRVNFECKYSAKPNEFSIQFFQR